MKHRHYLAGSVIPGRYISVSAFETVVLLSPPKIDYGDISITSHVVCISGKPKYFRNSTVAMTFFLRQVLISKDISYGIY